MSEEERKPWMTPVIYNDDRFEARDASDSADEADDTRDAREVEERIQRGGVRPSQDRMVQSTDTTPLDYSRGPHDEEFGTDDFEPAGDDDFDDEE